MLKLSFFGSFRAQLDASDPIDFRTSKVEAMLAYLQFQAGSRVSRQQLVELLWPDFKGKQAAQNLRTTLYRLRKSIQDQDRVQPYITAERDYIMWNAFAPCVSDVQVFEAHIAAVRPLPQSAQLASPSARQHIKSAIDIYTGEFLQDLYIESDTFERWVVDEQERLHDLMMWALHLAAEQAERNGDYDQMIRYARQQLQYEKWREPAYQQLMRAYFEKRLYAQALEQYILCQQILQEHLGTQPSQPTRQLYEHIQARYLQPQPRRHNPFRGLHSFTEQDANYFFGREEITAQLVNAVKQQPWVVLIGVSGSGKSSTVHAGVLPQLKHSGHDWQIVTMRPGERPLPTLAELLKLEADHTQIDQLLGLNTQQRPLLLVIDAFEELYTLCQQSATQQAFIDLLLQATNHPDIDLTVLLTIRADFMGQAIAYRPFADIIQTSTHILGPMTESEMRRAIEEPVIAQRSMFEAGLVNRLLHDVGDEVGGLPLLEFTLTLLWEQQEDGRLTHQAYEKIGRVQGALVQHADGVIAALSPSERDVAQRVLVQMINLGENTDDTRRKITQSELQGDGWQLVQKLANARLVVTSRTINGEKAAEIAHEILIRQWPQLRGWMNADRIFRVWQQRLRAMLKQWQYSREDDGALLRGGLLVEAEEWWQTRREDLKTEEHRFIEASLVLRQQEEEAAEAQRQRELAQAQALAEAQRQRAESEAKNNARLQQLINISQSLSLATGAQLAWVENQRDLALSLAIEANNIPHPPPQAQQVLDDVAYQPGTRRILRGHTRLVLTVDVDRQSRFAISGSADASLRGWDLTTGEQTHLLLGHDGAVQEVVLLADGRRALSVSNDKMLKLWDVATSECLYTYMADVALYSLALTPDETQIWIGTGNGRLLIFDLMHRELVAELSGHTDRVLAVAISPDGATAVSGGDDQDLLIWNVADRTLRWRIEGRKSMVDMGKPEFGHGGIISAICFSQSNEIFLSASQDRDLIRWHVATGEKVGVYDTGLDLFSGDWERNGRYAAAGTLDNRVLVIDTWHQKTLYDFIGHQGRVNCVRLTPDARQIISGSEDGTLRVWDLHHGQESRRMDLIDPPFSLALSPDGQTGLAGLMNGDVAVWDYATGDVIRRLKGHQEPIFPGVYFANDGVTAVTAACEILSPSHDRTVRVWNWQTGEQLACFADHGVRIWHLAISSDNQWVATSAHDGCVRLWHIHSGERRVLHDYSPQAPRTATFSPDGRYVAVGLARGTSANPDYAIQLLDVATGATIRQFPKHQDVVTTLAFTPDGQQLISGSIDANVLIWNVATGDLLHELQGHTQGILRVAVHPQGELLATSSYDQTIILWDIPTSTLQRRLIGHAAMIMQSVFHPDGQTLLSASPDQTIREWDISNLTTVSPEWIADNRAVIPLTEQQKARYMPTLSDNLVDNAGC